MDCDIKGCWCETSDIRPSGQKSDSEKARWDLVPFGALAECVKVLTFGAKKYSDNNWQKVPDARKRYLAAMLRHIAAYGAGETNDSETGISHLAHALCCALFLIWFDQQEVD